MCIKEHNVGVKYYFDFQLQRGVSGQLLALRCERTILYSSSHELRSSHRMFPKHNLLILRRGGRAMI